MIDGERLLGSLVSTALGGGRRGRRRRRRLRRLGRRGSSAFGGLTGGALGLGALGVAIAAYEHFTQRPPVAASPPAGGPGAQTASAAGSPVPPPLIQETGPVTPPPLPPEARGSEALLLVRAMIAAANADGELDTGERGRIVEALVEADCTDEERGFMLSELDRPWPMSRLVEAATTPELSRQLYLASVMAIDADNEAERTYVATLADRLGLDERAVAEIEALLEGDDEP